MIDDITVIIKQERKIQNLKKSIFSSINHNLKTPLNGMIPLI